MNTLKEYVDYYHNRFSQLLTPEPPKVFRLNTTQEEKETYEERKKQEQLNKDTLFVKELDGFLYRDQGVGKDIKNAVIASVRTISIRTSVEIDNLLKRSPQFVDRYN